MIDGLRICYHIPLSTIHGTVRFLGSEKGCVSAYICINDGSIIGTKQASKRCIVASWVSMETRRWVFSVFLVCTLKGTVFI